MKGNFESTIFALSTNFAQSAIAVFRISGSECKKIAKSICKIQKLKKDTCITLKFAILNLI